jgi:hypothetical protein
LNSYTQEVSIQNSNVHDIIINTEKQGQNTYYQEHHLILYHRDLCSADQSFQKRNEKISQKIGIYPARFDLLKQRQPIKHEKLL